MHLHPDPNPNPNPNPHPRPDPNVLFQEFSITSCLDDLGDPPEDYAIPGLGIKPFGLACLLLMAYGYACLKYYQCWVTAVAKKQLEEEGVSRAVPGLASADAELGSVSVTKQPPARQPNGDQGHAEGSGDQGHAEGRSSEAGTVVAA